jgi:hypothetical protein
MSDNIVVKEDNGSAKLNPPEHSAGLVQEPRIGIAKGKFAVPDSFFEPLPDEMLNAFR